jgi:hypothetical protein
MIKINKDGISIYSEEQVLDQESIEVQKIVNIPEGRVKLQMEEDDSYKLIENLDSAHSSCSLSTLLKSDIDKEIIIEFLLDKKKDQIQTILNKLKPIPEGFIQIETDHICTTKSKWIEDGKPLCERYGFKYQGE